MSKYNYIQNRSFYLSVILLLISLTTTKAGELFRFTTKYMTLSVNEKGYIESLKSKSGKEYIPKEYMPALANLYRKDTFIHPIAAVYDKNNSAMTLSYSNGSVAVVRIGQEEDYLRMEFLSLSPVNGVDNVVWGPYNTTISKTLGEVISVVRDDEFAIGIMAIDDNTTSGLPCAGDMYQGCYIIHSPDPVKYPLPDSLREGQRFRIGGDGMNDVAFYSHPEEYYRFMIGNGATLEPEFGSSIALHARDRSKPFTILYPHFNDFPSIKAPRHLDVDPVEVDYIGSSIAFYGCPQEQGLKVIEQVVLNEGLPHVTRNGKWVKDPASFRTDIAWWGAHDSLISYANQLEIKAVQDEGLGEYYVNPADRWAGKRVTLNGEKVAISEYTKQLNENGIDYGLHTLAEFVQPHSSDVSPIPNPGLCTVLRTQIERTVSASDTVICVADTSYLNEHGAWDDNRTNALRLGQELITYKGVTTRKPYTLTGVKRGAYKTQPMSHVAGEELVKLQVNCYQGFIPGIQLQDEYADFYAKWLIDGGMNYIDFDGYESFTYQGHGHYSFKRFMRKMFDTFKQFGGDYLRVMGSCVFEGNWHYMSVCNIGGGNHMFNPVTNKWGIEGKDFRYALRGNYFPCTFGIQNFDPEWTVQTLENLQSKAIAWDATYMLGLSEAAVEKSPRKYDLFNAFRTWEKARIADVFPASLKEEMQKEENRYHLEQLNDNTWKMYRINATGKLVKPVVLKVK